MSKSTVSALSAQTENKTLRHLARAAPAMSLLWTVVKPPATSAAQALQTAPAGGFHPGRLRRVAESPRPAGPTKPSCDGAWKTASC